jgi:hypothetical protein
MTPGTYGASLIDSKVVVDSSIEEPDEFKSPPFQLQDPEAPPSNPKAKEVFCKKYHFLNTFQPPKPLCLLLLLLPPPMVMMAYLVVNDKPCSPENFPNSISTPVTKKMSSQPSAPSKMATQHALPPSLSHSVTDLPLQVSFKQFVQDIREDECFHSIHDPKLLILDGDIARPQT